MNKIINKIKLLIFIHVFKFLRFIIRIISLFFYKRRGRFELYLMEKLKIENMKNYRVKKILKKI